MEPRIQVVDVDYLQTQISTGDELTEGPLVPVIILKDNADNLYRIETNRTTVESVTEIFQALEDVRTSA